ncbi:MAG: choice-of-anchor J domain-containing protein [Bacteroidales bacterium]|nr:choice-of-anchor J domain-containing protein [Bacteroidales bacterium]
MKKIFNSIMAIAVAALAIVSCTKADQDELQEPQEGYRYSFSIVDDFASTKSDTKATLGTTGVVWEAGDKVGMFLTGYTGYANINVESTPKSVVLYSREEIPAESYAYSYYPYATDNSDKTNAKITLSNIQMGGTSAMPMAGVPFQITEAVPLSEETTPASASTNGTIKFLNLASIIEFNVFSTNTEFQSETIQSITIKTNDGSVLSGDGYLDLTQVSSSNENTLVLNFSNSENTYDEIKVNQDAPVADSKDNATHIYMAIRPGTYSGSIVVTTDVATYTWNIANKEFKRNYLKHYNMNLNNAAREEGVTVIEKRPPYEEAFTSNQGEFTINNVSLPEGQTNIWSFGTQYGAKITAYISGTNYAAESWLVSPVIDLTNGIERAEITFDQCINKYMVAGAGSIQIKEYGTETWTEIPNTYPTLSGSWSSFETTTINLEDYIGKKILFAFKYVSTSDKAGTWEIKNFSVHETEEPQCETPVISFNATTKTVTINCSTTGATIGYTTDGTDPGIDDDGNPTGTTQEYSEPFIITETCTVKAFAGASGYLMSEIAEKECVVANYSNFTWDLSTDNTVTKTDSELSWNYRGVTMVAAKAESTTATNNYCPPSQNSTRFYKNSTLTITPYSGSTIGYVELTATTEGYAAAFANSTWTNASATVSGTTVTIVPNNGANSFSATIGGTCGFTSVKVYYLGNLAPVSLSFISVSGQKTSFTQGDAFSFEGVVTATYSDGTTADVTSDATFTGYDMSTTGTQTVTVSYTEGSVTKTTSYNIIVNQAGVETIVYTLDGEITGGDNGYATESEITQNDISWKVTGNTTMSPWRIGGKSLTSIDKPVYSTTAIGKNISKIEITHGAASSIIVNSMTVIVSKNADFSNPVSTLTPTFAASGTVTVNRPNGADWSNCYYKIVYNVTVSSDKNKFLEFTKAEFTGK